MKNSRFSAAVLAATITVGSVAAPALADGLTSTRNIFTVIGAAAAVGITNYNHKKRIKNQEMQQEEHRQSSYREWYYDRHGYYPTHDSYVNWYYSKYGVRPSN